jgi:hypothetical protein
MSYRVLLATVVLVLFVASETVAQAQPQAEALSRADVRERHGKPDAFSILYYDEPGVGGSVRTVTVSQWTYFDEGLEYTFADEHVVAEDTIELQPGAEAGSVPYDPDQFQAYMSLDAFLEAIGLEERLGGPVDELVDRGELYFADHLIWGIKDGELRYVEAVALEAEAVGEEGE